jgi:3-dehydroquinate synthase
MMMESVHVQVPARRSSYEIKIGNGLLGQVGDEARAALGGKPRRVALVSNRTVFALFGAAIVRSLRTSGFEVAKWLMKDGERHKSLRSLEQALNFFNEAGLERNDAVVALGGGVVGDLAGFAAATYLRGIDFIQIPTTLLAQIDSSVGGKTGANLSGGKNLVGAFHQPRLVVIDTDTLQTLPRRELTAGWCEAVKQGAVGDRKLFDRTVRLVSSMNVGLRNARDRGARKKPDSQTEVYATELAATIAAHCRFKASIVAGDERESIDRDDRRSRRILNFGHTTAHALEAVTRYRRFRHGEAVGHGILVAGALSKNLGMLAGGELELLREAVTACGPLPRANDIDIGALMRAMKSDKKSVGGQIKWVLLERIGSARIVDGNEIDALALRAALRESLRARS